MASAPVWKDTYFSVLASASPYTYSVAMKTGNQISINGVLQDEVVTIYNGKAWVRPGESYINIQLNRIAANSLYSDLPDLRGVTSTTTYVQKGAYRDFYVVNSAGTTASTYSFLLDNSYEDVSFSGDRSMSEPINGHGTPGMLFLSTMFSASSQNVVTTLSPSAGSSYDTTHCGDVALYYLNCHGGWDCYLIEGDVTKDDRYTKYQISNSYNNTTLDFQKKTYNNVITTGYRLTTKWMSDDEAKRLARNLLSSNMMYLHDLREDKIYPVNCTETNGTYKTFRNQGRKLFSYVINVEVAQEKINIG